MIDTNQDEEQDPVRKILQSLQRIQAPKDFEVRLKRRIAGETSAKPTHGRLLSHMFTPTYAFSAMTLVATAAIAFSLFRSTYMSRENVPVSEGRNGSVRAPDSLHRTEAARSDSSPGAAASSRSDEDGTRSLPARSSPQDELERRGFLKEVAGTGSRPVPSGDLPAAPFLQSLSDSPRGGWKDSISRADSSRMDSLRRLLNRQQRGVR